MAVKLVGSEPTPNKFTCHSDIDDRTYVVVNFEGIITVRWLPFQAATGIYVCRWNRTIGTVRSQGVSFRPHIIAAMDEVVLFAILRFGV